MFVSVTEWPPWSRSILVEIKPAVGGASFVQLITALNLGLWGITHFRTWYKWAWKNVTNYRLSMWADFSDRLALAEMQADTTDKRKWVDLARYFVNKADSIFSSADGAKKVQGAVWNICRFSALGCFAWGIYLLYEDRCGPEDWVLAFPFPLYWTMTFVLMFLYCVAVRFTKWILLFIFFRGQRKMPGKKLAAQLKALQAAAQASAASAAAPTHSVLIASIQGGIIRTDSGFRIVVDPEDLPQMAGWRVNDKIHIFDGDRPGIVHVRDAAGITVRGAMNRPRSK